LKHRTTVALLTVVVAVGTALPGGAAVSPEPVRHVLVVLQSPTPQARPGHPVDARSLRPRAATLITTTGRAQALGLSVTPAADGTALDVSGPASLIRSTFGAPSAAGTLRTGALGVGALAVFDPAFDRPLFRAHLHPRVHSPLGQSAGQLTQAYGATHQTTGVPTPDVTTRPIVATIQLSAWNPASLTEYARRNGVYADPSFDPVASGLYSNRPVTQRTAQTTNCQNSAALDNSGEIEVLLDQEAVLGAAPGLRQRSYTAANRGSCIQSAYQAVLDDVQKGDPIVALSSSWGACEADITSDANGNNPGGDGTFIRSVDNVLQQLVAAGVTVTAATGDYGRFDCSNPDGTPNTSKDGQDFPASSPSVLAIGGTRHPNGTTPPTSAAPDTTWNRGPAGSPQFGGSGGGVSGAGLTANLGPQSWSGFPRPGYQAGIPPNSKRQLPDLALVGDPQTGINTWGLGPGACGGATGPCAVTYGGTSLSSPLFAAMIAQLVTDADPSRLATRGLGDLHQLLYDHLTAFTDVTSADTTTTLVTYPTSVGFDQATGLGTPVIGVLCGLLSAPRPCITAPSASRNPTVPVAIAVNPPTGTSVVATYVSTTDAGCTGASSPSQATSISLPEGASTVFARVGFSDGQCSPAASTRVAIDSHPPVVTGLRLIRPKFSSSQLAGLFGVSEDNTGVRSVTYTLIRRDTGTPVEQGTLPAQQRSVLLGSRPGLVYELRVSAADALGSGAESVVRGSAPADDRGARPSAGWRKVPLRGSYLGTVTRTEVAGATLKATLRGSTVGVLLVRTPTGGLAELIIDGRVRKVVDTSATRTRVGLAVSIKVKPGRHTVAVRVLGRPGATGRGTLVTVDGFTGR
jgi:hypothetical protein